MKNKYIILIVIGIILRLILSFSTFHPDIRAFQLGGQIVAEGHIADLYDYLSTLPKNSAIIRTFSTDLFIYPPSIYLVHGLFNYIFSNLIGMTFINQFLIEDSTILGNILFNFHLILLKFPYLIFDLIAGIYLVKIFNDPKQRFFIAVLWIFNPVNLYVTYAMGQFDLIPTTLTIISLYYALRKRLFLAAFLLGIGIAFKIYPLFLLIPLIYLGRNAIAKVGIFMLGILPYFISTLPYSLSIGYRSSALVAGQTLKSFYAQIPISGGESLILFPVVLVFLYLVLYYQKIHVEKLWISNFIILLIFFIFTHSHPQWFLWLTPFIIIDLVAFKFRHWLPVVLLVVSFISSLFFFDPSLTVGIFAPVWPNLYGMPSVWQILKIDPDYNLCRSILQSLFTGVALFYIYFHFFLYRRKIEDE